MPSYSYRCEACDIDYRILRLRPPQSYVCSSCNQPAKRVEVNVTSRIVETLDNGLMPRRVERPADAERLFKERAAEDVKRLKNGG